MKHSTLLAGVGLAALIAAAPAQASLVTVNGSQFTNGLSTQTIGGITWAVTAPSGGTFQQKTLGGFTGVGINPGTTTDEIDIGEVLRATSANFLRISQITFGVLFDGPEFGDVQEQAEVTIFRAGGVTVTGVLTNVNPGPGDQTLDTATWSLPGATVTNLSPSTATDGAVWSVDNPFGTFEDIVAIRFTAIAGTPGPTGTNQSDYTMVRLVTDVPEPATLALLGAGLLGLGFAARRRKAA